MVNQVFNQPNITPPKLPQLLENKKTEVKTEINCMAVGTIQNFDTTDQTVTVTVNYLRQIYGGALSSSDVLNNSTQAYPQILKCPLMILTGGNSYLTFPITVGDTCLIFFNDRDIDNWWSTGSSSSVPNSARVHDLNDAIVFVGIRSLAKSLTQYNTLGPQLTNGNAFVSVEDKIKLSVAGGTLKAALDSLMTALLNWVDTDGDTPNPATIIALNNAKTLIDGVLK